MYMQLAMGTTNANGINFCWWKLLQCFAAVVTIYITSSMYLQNYRSWHEVCILFTQPSQYIYRGYAGGIFQIM